MTKKLFDNSNLQGNIEWGNVPVGHMTDEELHSRPWQKITQGRDNASNPEWQCKQAQAQARRAESDWSNKLLGNKNGLGGRARSGMTNTAESNAKRSQSLMGIKRPNLKGVPKPQLTCPHCNKTGGKPQMIQYHFDQCKFKHNHE